MAELAPTSFALDGGAWTIEVPLASWGDEPVKIVFAPEVRDDTPLREDEVRLVGWAVEHERSLHEAVNATLVPKYPDPVTKLLCIVVHPIQGKDGVPYVGFSFDCSWDEKGLGVVMCGARLVEIGDADAAFKWKIAELDARRTGALPLFDLDPIGDKTLQAMAEVGRMRNQVIGRSFLAVWILVTGLGAVMRIGLFWSGAIGAAVAAALTKAYVSSRTDEIVAEVSKRYGVDRKALDPSKYIIEE